MSSDELSPMYPLAHRKHPSPHRKGQRLVGGGASERQVRISGTISGDGRFVAFDFFASNLVPDDRNGEGEAFVRDRLFGTTERVSVASDEGEGNGLSYRPVLSGDGRFVVFWSYANNVVANDTNHGLDVFVRDRVAGTTERVSASSTGEQTGDGRESYRGDISADGRFVAFAINATNLVPGDTNEDPQGYPYRRVRARSRRRHDGAHQCFVSARRTPSRTAS